ncbi:MAG: MmcB family DNA repair protein [Alphaproteobacteria bacterium]|nr:MmcB family DNA repair protein [Alphaproteobacteria bacterium]
MPERACLQPPPSAADLARGVLRWFSSLNYVGLVEFPLAGGRRADVLALGPRGQLAMVEIKRSLADLRADRKWPEYLDDCDRFYFAVPTGFAVELLPVEHGLLVADRYGAELLREAPEPDRRLAPARRRQTLLRFAQLAAGRLSQHLDPPV